MIHFEEAYYTYPYLQEKYESPYKMQTSFFTHKFYDKKRKYANKRYLRFYKVKKRGGYLKKSEIKEYIAYNEQKEYFVMQMQQVVIDIIALVEKHKLKMSVSSILSRHTGVSYQNIHKLNFGENTAKKIYKYLMQNAKNMSLKDIKIIINENNKQWSI